jgi:hypothetical protein
MIASVSAVSRPASTASRTGWAFQPLPNLNRETRQRLGKLRAGWTFSVICTELGYAVYKGRATWDQQRLGIGLRALARESGQSLGKVRRDVESLADLGLVVIHRPNVLHTSDPATGKIVAKAKGRCEETLLYLTITEAVLRPAKVHRGTGDGAAVVPHQATFKVHRGTTVRDSSETNTKNTPDGGADRVGTPPASGDAGLTAGEAPASILPVHAGRDEPAVPSERILPAPRAASPAPRQRHNGTQECRSAAEAAAAWHRRDPQKEAARREYLEAKARKATARATGNPQTADQPPRRPTPPSDDAAKAAFMSDLAVT